MKTVYENIGLPSRIHQEIQNGKLAFTPEEWRIIQRGLLALDAHQKLLDFVSNCRWITPDKIDHITSDAADLFRKYR